MGEFFHWWVGGIGIVLISVCLPAAGAEPAPLPQNVDLAGAKLEGAKLEGVDGVLLLRNKNLISGRIARLGERYRVVQPRGVMLVPAGQVWRCCRSREDAYAFLRRTEERLLARDHLELAQWCLRHDMLTQAARELLDARTLQEDLPALPHLERQLRQRLRLDAELRETTSDESPVGLESAGPAREAAPKSLSVDAPTSADLSRAARAEFARRIQPMLVGSCTTSGCHGPGGSERFQIDRLALAGGGHAELTRQNLAATLAQLELDHPEQSTLVEHARRQHGTADHPSTPLRRRQAALLIEWTQAVAGVQPEPVSEAPAVSPAAEQLGVDVVVPASYETGSEDQPAESVIVPRDRFDPAVFNGQ